jgi:cell wall-associated NlpC family hydrolase
VTALDPRLNAFRPDLADFRLEGMVKAEHYVEAKRAEVGAAVIDVRRSPDPTATLDTQFLLGERVKVFESRKGWSWIQSERDGYVGYVLGADLAPGHLKPTHEVIAPRTFAYREPDMKTPVTRALSMGSRFSIAGLTETRGLAYVVTDAGEAIVADHVRPIGQHAGDYVAYAERLLGTPYLWGGTSAFGVDCSGLVQLSMRMAGIDVLRDTPMQEMSIGTVIDRKRDGLKRGDLVFWKGHVAIVTDDGQTILHASGATMDVTREPLNGAIERIARLYGLPTSYRRP